MTVDEHRFLQAILDNPNDTEAQHVYADWLEERGADAKATFLRLMMARDVDDEDQSGRLRLLSSRVPTDWRATISKLIVENCTHGPERIDFDFVCSLKWQDLAATNDPNVRHCHECKKSVFFCATIDEARMRARVRECVAVDVSVVRTKFDLHEPLVLGAVAMPGDER